MVVIVMLLLKAAGFLLQFVLEMSRFYTMESCVTHKINALDDFFEDRLASCVRHLIMVFLLSAASVVAMQSYGF